ncbi:MAG: hypothetical protein LAT67_02685 [Balneolales bacterium]|nr:hypothetical protein [Balneolales bacterium]
MKTYLLILFSTLLTFGCLSMDLDNYGPGKMPVPELMAAPDTLYIGDQALVMDTYLLRDFMPTSNPNSNSLSASLTIKTTDLTPFPESLTADAAWIVNIIDVWDTYLSGANTPPSQTGAHELRKVARNGPMWNTGLVVEVIVRLRHTDGSTYLLRAPNQRIMRTG